MFRKGTLRCVSPSLASKTLHPRKRSCRRQYRTAFGVPELYSIRPPGSFVALGISCNPGVSSIKRTEVSIAAQKMALGTQTTVDEHFRRIRSQGEEYIAKVLRKNPSALTREHILAASFRYFEHRQRIISTNRPPSQSSQIVVPSQVVVSATRPDSALQNLIASALDNDLSVQVLIDACAKAADFQLSEILIKCLYTLANIGSICDEKNDVDGSGEKSQSQIDDDEIFGVDKGDEENINPQTGQREGGDSQRQASGGKRAKGSHEVSVGRTGQSFVDEFVSRLVVGTSDKPCSRSRSNDAFVSSVAKEAPLSGPASENVVQLLTRRMKSVDLFELPPYIYQLLLLASARAKAASKSDIILQITQVFAQLEKKTRKQEELSQYMLEEDEDAILTSTVSLKELRQVQGTALLHIEYAVKQDPTLSAEITKLAKAGVETPQHFLTAFGTGILLSLARSNSSQMTILNILREAIIRFGREMVLRKQNIYAARVSMNDDDIVDPRKSILFVADCTSENGWEDVKESLMNFALLLLDKPLDIGNGDCSNQLGEKLLFKLFSSHSVIRDSILENLTTRITLQEKSAYQAISVIKTLANEIPFSVLENTRHVRDGIEFLVTLPPWMAGSLIKAYTPLLLARQDLRDHFHLVIRKSLFHRDSSSRAVAITGFLTVMSLCSSVAVGASSQVHRNRNSHVSAAREHETDKVIDAIQPIRRIFSYSAPLRALLYKTTILHLQDEDIRISSTMATAIGEILRVHLQKFVEPNTAPYIVIEHCVDESSGGILVEPLGDLIWCLAIVEQMRDATSYHKSYVLDLAKKVAGVSLQDFAIAKDLACAPRETTNNLAAETHSQTAEEAAAKANRNKARIVGSVCEALIHAVLIMSPEVQTWSVVTETLIPLLALKARVFEMLRGVGVSSATDAFIDLGGDPAIEQLRPGMRMLLQRGVRPNGKKSGKRSGSRKMKGGEDNSASSAPHVLVENHRFGAFSVLSSASSRPTLPLSVVMRTLQLMADATSHENNDARNAFRNRTDSREFQELRVYLLAAAQKHLEDFISSISKESRIASLKSSTNVSGTESSVNALARMAMGDFKRFRRSASNTPGQGGITALQISERCACAATFLAKQKHSGLLPFCNALLLTSTKSEEGHECEEEIFEGAAGALEQLVSTLLDDELFKEAALALRTHDAIVTGICETLPTVEKTSSFLDKRVQWAVDMFCERKISDIGMVKTLVHACLLYTENNNDLRRAGHLSLRLLEVIGDCDENALSPKVGSDNNEKLCSALSVTQETSLAVVDATLDAVDRAICDVEWCLGRMTSLEAAVGTSSIHADSTHSKGDQVENFTFMQKENISKQAIRAEDAAQVRLEGIVRTLRGLARCAIAKWSHQERLLKTITRAYKLISTATQAQAKRRGDPRTTFISLINECKGLAPTLWTYLAFAGAEAVDIESTKGASRAAREARIMPQLVYEVEKFEKVLIAVQKRTKINLLRGMRRNIARDFRIREDLLREEQSSDERMGEEEVKQLENPRMNQGNAKRRRT